MQAAESIKEELAAWPDYTYLPLQPGEATRIVEIQTLPDRDEVVVSKVQHISLNDGSQDSVPPYEALSYRCGPDKPPRFIRCINGTTLSVRPYLFDAIKGLGPFTEPRVLWIDQVSVNQNDNDERAKQVRNFDKIFAQASLVQIWIREDDDSVAEAAFSLINSICVEALANRINKDNPTYRDKFLNEILNIPSVDAPESRALRRFLKNEWFSRTWTFQEIALAKDALFHCGPHQLRLARLVILGSLLGSFLEGPRTTDSIFRECRPVLTRIATTRAFLHNSVGIPEAKYFGTLFHQLVVLRNTQCHEPQDKIWTIISTAGDVEGYSLEISYNKPWQSVYIMVSHWFHCQYRGLAFLQLVEIKNRPMRSPTTTVAKPDLPSWVPDFRTEPDALNLLYQPIEKLRDFKIYSASGSSQSTSDGQNMYSDQLQVRGIKIGTIVRLSMPAGNLMNGVGIGQRVHMGDEWHLLAKSCANDKNKYTPTGESIDRAYERLRIADQLPGEGLHRRQREIIPDMLPQPKEFTTMPINAQGDLFVAGESADVGGCILRATTRRRMFLTDTGYMGLTHRSNVLGDEIWVLLDADMPVTLHPADAAHEPSRTKSQIGGSSVELKRKFEFRGESYVHGIMDGGRLW